MRAQNAVAKLKAGACTEHYQAATAAVDLASAHRTEIQGGRVEEIEFADTDVAETQTASTNALKHPEMAQRSA